MMKRLMKTTWPEVIGFASVWILLLVITVKIVPVKLNRKSAAHTTYHDLGYLQVNGVRGQHCITFFWEMGELYTACDGHGTN